MSSDTENAIKPKEHKGSKKSKDKSSDKHSKKWEKEDENKTLSTQTNAKEVKAKHKRKRDGNAENNSTDVSQDVTNASRKRRKKDGASSTMKPEPESEAEAENHDEPVKKMKEDKKEKEKKTKKEKSMNEDNRVNESLQNPNNRKMRRKSPKESEDTSSTLRDPENDTDLQDKARAAMLYVYKHQTTPTSWKFNKGHQNWIAKHFFSIEEVPDKYLPLVINYLATCKGGVRTTLIDNCKKLLDPVSGLQSSGDQIDQVSVSLETVNQQKDQRRVTFATTSTDSPVSEEHQNAKKSRAGSLLTALEQAIP